MRARWILAAVLLSALSVAADAAPVGAVRPNAGHWSIGADLGFQFMRPFQRETQANDEFESDERFAYLGRVSYGLNDRWEVYGRLGAATLKVLDTPNSEDGDSGPVQTNNYFDMGTEFTWGVGVAGIAIPDFLPNLDLAVAAQYLQHGSHDGSVTSGVSLSAPAENWDYSEWEIALLFQTSMYDPYMFYAGPVLSNARISRGNIGTVEVADLEAADNVGVALGISFDFIEGGTAYVEARLVDESAVHTGFLWAF